jgi:hypothetical protein
MEETGTTGPMALVVCHIGVMPLLCTAHHTARLINQLQRARHTPSTCLVPVSRMIDEKWSHLAFLLHRSMLIRDYREPWL